MGYIFILSLTDELAIQDVNPYSAFIFIEIANNTYTGAFLTETQNISVHFQQCEKLVKAVPVLTLGRPHEFGKMKEVIGLITSYVSALPE